MRLAATAAAAALAATSAVADDDIVRKTSPHDVATTVDRLEAAFEGTDIKVLARVDHAEAAAGAGMELRPTTLLIFGNPELGTPLMQESQAIGLDLPMRVLVYEDEAGDVHVLYHEPEELADEHDIDEDHEVVEGMEEGLDKLTDGATAPE